MPHIGFKESAMNTLFRAITSPSSRMSVTNGDGFMMDEVKTEIFVRDFEVQASIGVYDEEKDAKQPLIISAWLEVNRPGEWQDDNFEDVVSYETVIEEAEAIAASGHINLVETFAEKLIAALMLNEGVLAVSVNIDKPNAFGGNTIAGVRISRRRDQRMSVYNQEDDLDDNGGFY